MATQKNNVAHKILFVFVHLLFGTGISFAQSPYCRLPQIYSIGQSSTSGDFFNSTIDCTNDFTIDEGCTLNLNLFSQTPGNLMLKMDVGENYNFGKNVWSANFDIVVKLFDDGVEKFDSPPQNFSINQESPEQLIALTIPSLAFLTFNSVQISSTDGEATSIINESIRLSFWFEHPMPMDADNTVVSLLPIPSGNNYSTEFRWETNCGCIPSYEFQLLRLYNIDPDIQDETMITAEVDWAKALTIETQSSDPSLTLSAVEGTGYYLWRVRPIGSEYPGGYADSRNWGKWSDAAFWSDIENNGGIVTINNPNNLPPQIFYHEQFDADINWIYSRTFSEAEPGSKVKIAEEMTYANGLLQVEQHQKHLFSQGQILANRTVLDYTGRPALSTIYAPVAGQNHVGYVENFANKTDNIKYGPADFDSDANFQEPSAINAGILNNYYSDANPDKTIPSAEGYAFSRTIYYGDGMNRVKEASGIGKPLRINEGDNPHTNRFYYSGVSDTELVRIFGDEAPKANSVIKMMAIDPNQTVTVTYQDKEGQTLATCLSANSNEAHHDPLPSRDAFQVVDEITGNISCGDGCLLSSKTVSFNTPTTVTLNYELTPNTVEEMCTNLCTTCDCYIKFSIKRVDDPYDGDFPINIEPINLPPEICTSLTEFVWTNSYDLPPGTFLIERRIEVYNVNPNSIDQEDDPFGDTYIEEQMTALQATLETEINNDPLWQTIQNYLNLDNPQPEELYNYLIVNEDMPPGAEEFTDTIGCCTFTIPVFHCVDCPIENGDYEGHFSTVYPGTTAMEYLSGFQSGQFNTMIQNMQEEDGYSATDLCACWGVVVQAWESLNQNSTENYEPNLLNTFLDCAGRRFNEPTTFPPAFDPEHAYEWTYIIGSSPYCEQGICFGTGVENDPFFQAEITCTADGLVDWDAPHNLTNEQWEILYHCTQSVGEEISQEEAEAQNAGVLEQMEEACNDACENRLQSFVTALHYIYEMEIGAIVEEELESEDDFPFQQGDSILLSTLYCQAHQLVELCKQNCQPFSAILDENDNIISYGTEAELLAYQQAMYYAFDLAQGGIRGRCPQGFSQTTASLPSATTVLTDADFTDFLLEYLNTQWATFLNSSIEGAGFDLIEALNNFQPGLSESCIFNPASATDGLLEAISGSYFEIKDCNLTLVSPPERPDDDPLVILVCTDVCGSMELDCGAICLKWLTPITHEPDHVFEFLSCEEQTADHALTLLSGQYHECIEDRVEALETQYLQNCIDPDSIKDIFTVSYELGYYHYTLYYHDRAGNLVQTIAPEGVDEDNTTRLERTNHEFRTQYRYNSLGQLIWQRTPDGGETQFWYDDFGQLRFSQNAQQAEDGFHAYTKYDYLGRVIEVGKAAGIDPDLENANIPRLPYQRHIGMGENLLHHAMA